MLWCHLDALENHSHIAWIENAERDQAFESVSIASQDYHYVRYRLLPRIQQQSFSEYFWVKLHLKFDIYLEYCEYWVLNDKTIEGFNKQKAPKSIQNPASSTDTCSRKISLIEAAANLDSESASTTNIRLYSSIIKAR